MNSSPTAALSTFTHLEYYKAGMYIDVFWHEIANIIDDKKYRN